MTNEGGTGVAKKYARNQSNASGDGFVNVARDDGAPSEASDPVRTGVDAVTPNLAGLLDTSVVAGISAANLETPTGDADYAVALHPSSAVSTGTSLGNVETVRDIGRSGGEGNQDRTFAIDNHAEWDNLLSREALRHKYSLWLNEVDHVINTDILRIPELLTVRPSFPEGIDRRDQGVVEARVNSALAESREYGLRFAGEVRARCESLGLVVRKTEAGAFTVDHFVTVTLSTSASRRLVEVNRKRLEDPVTVERAVDLIRTQHRAIRSGFDARDFLTRLFDAYRHVASTRNNPQPTLTLAECLAAIRMIIAEHRPVPGAAPRRGRPPLASGSAPGPRSTVGEYSQTRFRSDLSQLLASDADKVVAGHRLHIQQARGPDAMLLIEPRSGNPVHYRYLEFRRISSNGG
ncbi:MAG: hypothetical protein EBT09_10015 [Actinobacteria bacterium]|nr:hypothetical protein [Actinomycetota bacterium]